MVVHKQCRIGQTIVADESVPTPSTLSKNTTILLCPAFFRLPLNPQECHGRSQGTAIIQEIAHFNQVSGANDNNVQKAGQQGTSDSTTPWAFYANGKSIQVASDRRKR